MLSSKVRLKLRRARKKDQRKPPLDVGKLKDPITLKSYQTDISNRCTVLLDQ